MLITGRFLVWLRQTLSLLWIKTLSRLVPYSIVLLISYLLLPVSLPEGQKDQVGQVGQSAGQSSGQKARGQVLNLRWSEDKSLSGSVKVEYNGVYPPTPYERRQILFFYWQ